MTTSHSFHPAVEAWFRSAFPAPTDPQRAAWPAIQQRRPVLIAAPTGSGKTLAAFLATLDMLVREGLASGLPDETRIVYVSPLKALSNDIERNLRAPLEGIRAQLRAQGLPDVDIRVSVRTGDTPQRERTAMRKRPPHIIVTTPESLYILLGSASGRAALRTVHTVIVDEIHAVVGNKRGAHLALSLERLTALTDGTLKRVGLSATQRPIEAVARFLTGGGAPDNEASECFIVDSGHVRQRDLAIEVTATPLAAVLSGDAWTEVYDRLTGLIETHRTTLVFVNTRRHAERVARHLSERMGREKVTAHHGSLSKELRLDAEERLKSGALRALVATASLELGIDIGHVDLVCQLGSPRSIAALLQRVGRSGHRTGGVSKGRLFPLSRDDLVECAALIDAVRRGELDLLSMPRKPLDVLAQQIVAEVAAREWSRDDLFALLVRAYPYRDLTRAEFDEVVGMLADGYSTRPGRHGALVHQDDVNHTLRARKNAHLVALTSGGTIPDNADYQVVLEPQAITVGTVNEDFAVESIQGDIFQLGNLSYRILRVEQGRVRVEDAHGQPPSIPFWLGEAPGRTDDVSRAVARLRAQIEARLGTAEAMSWLIDEVGIDSAAADQLVGYLGAARAALGRLPTQRTIVLERFFDASGGMQLVVHAPFGSRVNRAWGLALRKRFCRSFNFELQAAATEDAILLSLTGAHSFELADVARYLQSASVRALLIQAACAAPMFTARWRWVASLALALPRFRGGRRVAAPLARMAAEDLLTSVFPDQVACAENLPGELEIPDHPLIRQTLHDCLEEAMDASGFEDLLRRIESGAIEVLACDATTPSPLALEVLSARPYAFLDDAPLEERRAQAVMARRYLDPESAADIGRLDPTAIERVRGEAWPDATSSDELHEALSWLTFLTDEEITAQAGWRALVEELIGARRIERCSFGGLALWATTERAALLRSALCESGVSPEAEAALVEIVRGRLQGLGPVCAASIASSLQIPAARSEAALAALECEGFALRGRFTAGAHDTPEWCERRLLARIHRYTVKHLRAQIEPVEPRDYQRFLFEWQRVTPAARMRGPDALGAVLGQLEGFDAPAGAWETEILPARLEDYDPAWLDEQCVSGRFVWTRLSTPASAAAHTDSTAPVRSSPISLLARRNLRLWASLSAPLDRPLLSSSADRLLAVLQARGALFFDELVDGSGLLPARAEEALAELVARGLVNSDGFGGLRALLVPARLRRAPRTRPSGAPPLPAAGRRRRISLFGMDSAGRWALVAHPTDRLGKPGERAVAADSCSERQLHEERTELVARALLRRWGVVYWRLLAREAAWMPPWRELLMVLRRLEARGEIRGGRFVAGLAGEQFAVTEAIAPLRRSRHRPEEEEYVSVSAADPLNLVGIITPGGRLPAISTNRVLYRDGVPVAVLQGREVRHLQPADPARQWRERNLLLRRRVPASLADLS